MINIIETEKVLIEKYQIVISHYNDSVSVSLPRSMYYQMLIDLITNELITNEVNRNAVK